MPDRTCSIAGCSNPHKARGLCQTHYTRWQRGSDVSAPLQIKDPVERFWSKVAKLESGCWEWQGFRHEGYGRSTLPGFKTQAAHRLAYGLCIGPIPDGMELDHLCRNPCCVNPSHLEPVTHAENTRRALPFRPTRSPSNPDDYRCPKGHDPSRLGHRPDGYPKCLECMADYQRAYLRRKSGA